MRLSFSLTYAPPEVAVVAQQQGEAVVAAEAVDMWALGLVAYELLTGTVLFQPFTATKDSVLECLTGRKALPWEAGGWEASEERRALGGLKGGVMACLQRDPCARPSASAVRRSWSRLFEYRTTHEGPGPAGSSET